MGIVVQQRRSFLKRRTRSNRSGYLYIAVLFTTLILITIVSAAMRVSALRTKSEVSPALRQAVLRAAESEVHRLAVKMRTDTTWRTANGHNVFSSWRTSGSSSIFGNISVRHRYLDTDGDLADGLDDPVELQVHTKHQGAETAISVKMVSDPQPYGFLKNSITTINDLQVNSGAMITCGGPAGVGDD